MEVRRRPRRAHVERTILDLFDRHLA